MSYDHWLHVFSIWPQIPSLYIPTPQSQFSYRHPYPTEKNIHNLTPSQLFFFVVVVMIIHYGKNRKPHFLCFYVRSRRGCVINKKSNLDEEVPVHLQS